MSAHCMLTGARPGFGNRISHSHRRSSRRFDPNVQRKRYWLASEGRHVRLRLSDAGQPANPPRHARRRSPAAGVMPVRPPIHLGMRADVRLRLE